MTEPTEAVATPEEEKEDHRTFALELTTEIEPATKFTIDGVEYDLLGIEHLSDDDEAKVTARFARHMNMSQKLMEASTDKAAEQLARKMKSSRISLLTLLTSAPRDVVLSLGLSAQNELLTAIQEEMGIETGDESDSE